MMLLDVGDTVLVSHRRMFQHDESRFFVGKLIGSDHELLKLQGYTFVRDLSSGKIIRKDEMRIKLLSLASPGYIYYQIAGEVDVENLSIDCTAGEETLTDGRRVLMNLAERSHSGHI
jgi:hypothetical protein